MLYLWPQLEDYKKTLLLIMGDYTQIGRRKSNVGGVQSVLLGPEDMPDKLKSDIDAKVLSMNPNLKMISWWVNINGNGHRNDIHDHHDRTPPAKLAGISGVFYVDIPDDNMGDILFFGKASSSSPILRFEARPNRLILFSSDYPHSVEENLSDKDRISLSFNYIENEND